MPLSTTTRSAPDGDKPGSGLGIKIALSGDANIEFWE